MLRKKINHKINKEKFKWGGEGGEEVSTIFSGGGEGKDFCLVDSIVVDNE